METEYKIKRHILLTMLDADVGEHIAALGGCLETEDEIDMAWESAEEYETPFHDSEIIDDIQELRCSGDPTDLRCKRYSNHYESEQVANKLKCGTYVSWTYWSGGGKHGEPEEIDWMSDAYEVSCEEEEKVVTVRTYIKMVF